jgi:tRNA nucleotidyltransferase (CCA-adding enzyme)
VTHLAKLNPAFRRQVEIVREAADELSIIVWLVGGPVRDLLLGRDVRDLDFVVESGARLLAEEVARRAGGKARIHEPFLAARVILSPDPAIDILTARTERYRHPGALPEVEPAGIEEDLWRRDFSVNALALEVDGEAIVDPAGGVADLERRLIRVLHEESFLDDPTRILRALRLSTRLDFSIESHTAALLAEAVAQGSLGSVSGQRLWREVALALEEDDVPAVLAAFLEAGVVQSWLGAKNQVADLIGILDSLSAVRPIVEGADGQVVYLAALLSAFGITEIPGGTDFSRRRKAATQKLVRERQRLSEAWAALSSDEERARFCLDHTPEEIMVASAAASDSLGHCIRILGHRLPFGGDALGVEPGPHVAAALRDARIESWLGRIAGEELLSFARDRALGYLRERS